MLYGSQPTLQIASHTSVAQPNLESLLLGFYQEDKGLSSLHLDPRSLYFFLLNISFCLATAVILAVQSFLSSTPKLKLSHIHCSENTRDALRFSVVFIILAMRI